VRLAALVLLACFGLAAYLEWAVFPVALPDLRVKPAPSSAAGAPTAAGLSAALSVDEAGFEVIEQRPVFVWDRKPVEKDVAGGQPTPEAGGLENLHFNGVVITPRGPMALVKDNKTGETKRLTQGSSIAGWTVKTIGEQALKIGRAHV
jgi:hypothetical protein